MAYIIQNGGSGYSRADFVSAIDGKQDVLVSEQNIKTINGQSVLGSGNIEVSAREYDFGLSQLESSLKDAVVAKFTNSETGLNKEHKYVMFGVISDMHQCVTVNDRYGSVYADAIPSLRLLGAIAQELSLDAVICSGDIVDGHDSMEYRRKTLAYVQSKFEQYIPCPYFITDGNHERFYNNDGFSNSEWDTICRGFNNKMGRNNIEITYLNDEIKKPNSDYKYKDGTTLGDGESSNAYCIDFNDKKVRIGILSPFDNGTWVFHGLSMWGLMKFDGREKKADEWVLGICNHSYRAEGNGSYKNAQLRLLSLYTVPRDDLSGSGVWNKTYSKPNGETKGKASFGFIGGHKHHTEAIELTSNTGFQSTEVLVTRAHLMTSECNTPIDHSHNTGNSVTSYGFSLFVVNTDECKLYEVCVGRDERLDGTCPGTGYCIDDVTEGVTIYKYNMALPSQS